MNIKFCSHKLGPQNTISKIRSLPYVFTEQGVAMLATVIRTDIAVDVSIRIMDAFVDMKKIINLNSQMVERVTNIEYKLLLFTLQFTVINSTYLAYILIY